MTGTEDGWAAHRFGEDDGPFATVVQGAEVAVWPTEEMISRA